MERYQDVGGTTKKWGNIWSLCHHSAGSAWQESILVPGSGCVCVWVCVCVCVCVCVHAFWRLLTLLRDGLLNTEETPLY